MYSQHLTHELMLCLQITRGRVKFYGDSAVISHSDLNLWPSGSNLLRLLAGPSLKDLAILMSPLGRAFYYLIGMVDLNQVFVE